MLSRQILIYHCTGNAPGPHQNYGRNLQQRIITAKMLQ
jgi:hypothetical protein